MNLKNLLKRAIATTLVSMLCLITFAQGHSISGIIKDATGEPMIGVNVLEKGTTNGVITNIDGHFTLNGITDKSILVISYIGYVQQTITVGNQKSIAILLKEDATDLNEVVVIGYGTVKKRDLTGSVASVTAKDLVRNPVSNVAQALQGQLPGVSVVSQDGRPGANVSIRVRGGGSITQSNEPLFIVDGFPVSSIGDIPADQVESIDVLKDAASTAIYGARGANGVILVTTKSGKEGKVSVKYSGYVQTKSVSNTNQGLDAQDYINLTWGVAAALGGNYREGVENYFGLGSTQKNGNQYSKYADIKAHNYADDVLRTALGHNHNLSMSGGSDKTKIMFNVNYLEDEGIKIKSGYSRWNASLKLQQEITKNLDFSIDVRYSEVSIEGKNDNGWVSGGYYYRPIDTPLGDGDFAAFGNGDKNVDPSRNLWEQVQTISQINKRQNLRAMGTLSWEIIKGLKASTELGLGRNWGEEKYYDNGYIDNKSAKLTSSAGWNIRSATTLNWQVQGLGENHSLSFLVGNEVLTSKSNKIVLEGAGYPDSFGMDEAFGMINQTTPSLGRDKYSNTIGVPEKTVSFFGRGNYSFMGRYLLTATFRSDGSSKFAPNNRWAYFPAGAVAWRLSDEPFMQSTKDWLDNLKVRLSYGTAGSDGIDAGLWKEIWNTQSLVVDGNTINGYKPGDMKANPNLKWETTTSRNFGLDFGFWNNKLHGTLDIYWNSTKDLLMKVPIDSSTGFSYQYQNIGETSNKGFELALAYDIVRTEDFNLSVSGTYNYNRNNVEKLANNVQTEYRTGWGSTMMMPYNDYTLQEGRPVGLIKGFINDGFYQIEDFTYANGIYTLKPGIPDFSPDVIKNYPGQKEFNRPDGQNAFPGALKLRDTAGDDNKVTSEDATVLGEVTPHHTGGFNINASYKGFDFNAGFAWQIGGKVYNATAMSSMNASKDDNLGANRLDIMKDAYKIYDIDSKGDLVSVTDPTALAALNRNAKYALPYYENAVVLSNWVEDASFLRLNTLTIGYTLPKMVMKKIGIQNLRVYATAGNLFCINGYSGLDPEVNTKESNDGFPTLGYDYNTYPRAKTFTFGVNIDF